MCRRKLLGMVPLFLLAAIAGCGRAPASSPPPPPKVSVIKVQPQRVVLSRELPGRTVSAQVSEVRPQVSGLIQKRLFAEGADVTAGEVLYQIDSAPYDAAFQSAQANVEAARKAVERARASLSASLAGVQEKQATEKLARLQHQRMESLYAEKAVSASERDKAVTDLEVVEAALRVSQAAVESERAALAAAEAAVKQAEAAEQTARINLGYTRVTAPISGRIGRSSVTEGATVTAYQPMALATIQSLDPLYVDVPQSTAQLIQLRQLAQKGDLQINGREATHVKLVLEDGTVYPHPGELQFREVSVDPTTGTVMLRITAPNPEGHLLPGMFVRAIIDEAVNEQAILVPQQAVSRDPRGNPMAMVVDASGQAEQRKLVTERAIGDQWLVSCGLSSGEMVIVEGLQRVRPGMKVEIVDSAAHVADAK